MSYLSCFGIGVNRPQVNFFLQGLGTCESPDEFGAFFFPTLSK